MTEVLASGPRLVTTPVDTISNYDTRIDSIDVNIAALPASVLHCYRPRLASIRLGFLSMYRDKHDKTLCMR